MNAANLFEQVREKFSSHLEKNHLRKTPERYAILEEIYSRSGHFDAEELFIDLKKKKFHVSRATVYNTLELLVNCGLVKKHQFTGNQSHYEKAFGYRQHDHLLCIECGKVLEFCDPRIQQISSMMGELLNFDIPDHSLILYGHCRGCELQQQPKKISIPQTKSNHAI